MLSKIPFDPSIMKFVKKENYENCTKLPLLSSIVQNENGQNLLILNKNELKYLNKKIFCCWSPIIRPIPKKPIPEENFDSSITVEKCIEFNNSVILTKEIETLMVTCNEVNANQKLKKRSTIYKNVHSIINVEKISNRFNHSINDNKKKKLSVLILGLDNVSRLNFQRNLPKTVDYLNKNEWLIMKGYNKMGENTFPNLMAILTGQGQEESHSKCTPNVPFGLDNCPLIWYNFRNAGYVTAYAEDEAPMSTFNLLKVGFVEPPTDYYLRPYIIATEKLLKIHKRFECNYCTGPELSEERIINSAVDFAIRLSGFPYFGFFWANSVTHDSINGLSIMDFYIHSKLKQLEENGVMNETMIIFLSDHGMRMGEFRKTFMGWYEERLPFLYIWLPKWFRDANPKVHEALKINQNRLTSPFDIYETLRDILMRNNGSAKSNSNCPKCTSLFKKVSIERGCQDAGIPSHWCVCSVFEMKNEASGKIVLKGAQKIVNHIENIVKNYKTKTNIRLCSKLNLKKIHKFHQILNLNINSTKEYYYMIELTPGNAKFEATINYNDVDFSINDREISRIDSYRDSSKCLDYGQKRYCHCIN
ncbi:uncharacterized protein LOC127291270 [Leptopilina boulardi]|uniref:uncharacterized protein LOC127291270 n=1 Tax=Leptopilina boulardi TaxID=63433 RepID=UPI0021F66DD0|nr:uncharacterized protein LOC127291270 [Leptopilina boulardi]